MARVVTVSAVLVANALAISCDRDGDDRGHEELSFAEYERAMLDFKHCVEEAGYSFFEFGKKPTNAELYVYVIPGEAVDSGVEGRCYSAFLDPIEAAWQADVARRHPERDETFQALAGCVQQLGLAVPDGASIESLVALLAQHGVTVQACAEGDL